MPIQSFRHKGLKRLFEDGVREGVPPDLADKIENVLAIIEDAEFLDDLAAYPGWRLHPLKGDYAGFWSIKLTGNWRIVFRFEGGDAFDIDLVDYH